jgi:hypothetical protein
MPQDGSLQVWAQKQLLVPAAVLELVVAQAQQLVLARAAVAEQREQVRLLVQAVVPVSLRVQRQRNRRRQ